MATSDTASGGSTTNNIVATGSVDNADNDMNDSNVKNPEEEEMIWNREREAPDFELVEGPSFQRTLSTLLWKDYQQFCKSKQKSFCCRITCPTISILLLAFFRLLSGDTIVPEGEVLLNVHTFRRVGNSYYVHFSAVPPDTHPNELLDGLCDDDEVDLPPGFLAIAPNPYECDSSEQGFTDKQCELLLSLIDVLNMSYTYDFNSFRGWCREMECDNSNSTSSTTTNTSTEVWQNGTYYYYYYVDNETNTNTSDEDSDVYYSDCQWVYRECQRRWYYGDCGDYFGNLTFTEGFLIAYFNGNDDINDYVESNDYGVGYTVDGSLDYRTRETNIRPIGAAIVFNDISEDGLQWDYTIRVNSSSVPSTKKIVDIFERDLHELRYGGYYQYVNGRFPNFQEWIDQSISYFIANITDNVDSEFSK